MRLIDANAVRRWLIDWQFGDAPALHDDKDREKAIIRYETLDIILSGIDDPYFTIEAEPVRHGRWLFTDTNTCECSVCHTCEPYPFSEFEWCPNCGAKMGGDVDER